MIYETEGQYWVFSKKQVEMVGNKNELCTFAGETAPDVSV